MSEWIINAWATGARGRVRVTVSHPSKPDANEGHALGREASALYRRTYQEWADDAPEFEIYPAHEAEAESTVERAKEQI